MDQYTKTAYRLAEQLTKDYSTSFSLSSRLFSASIRPHIYAIYGLVRVADEIVDTYQGVESARLLDELERQTLELLSQPRPFSANPIVHAFVLTAQKFKIDAMLITPFFASMRMDLTMQAFTREQYDQYIYGSAEVIGLMCLRVFTEGDSKQYSTLQEGAQALGRAYQKVNFLRDIEADHTERQRWYFPNGTFADFDASKKQHIESEIETDFTTARQSLPSIPSGARKAVATSYAYYYELFEVLKKSSPDSLKTERQRVPNPRKLALMAREVLRA